MALRGSWIRAKAMPEIEDDIDDFALGKNATTINPLQEATHQEQRGPSCGFYALGYVMQYWYERGQALGIDYKVKAPLAPRTKMEVAQDRDDQLVKQGKKDLAVAGEFFSLRQYGKHNKLTAYGSVFNAGNLVKVAQGAGSQYAGQYDGRTLATSSSDDLITKAKNLIEHAACPVIIPFDVSTDGDSCGDPVSEEGKAAHWAVLVGFYEEAGDTWFLNYHWGEYHYCRARDMANSCHQLHSNAFLVFHKYEVRERGTDDVIDRDNMTEATADLYRREGFVVTRLAENRVNYEFCDPVEMKMLTKELKLPVKGKETYTGTKSMRKQLRKHGFDPNNLANNGLRRKMVAIFPASVNESIRQYV